MSVFQPPKKIRLSAGNPNNDPTNNDFRWGDDPEVDDDIFHQIETQGYSQYPICLDSRSTHDHNPAGLSTMAVPSKEEMLQSELQTRIGEVTNLRLEMQHREKEYQTQIVELKKETDQLRKQLSGKKTEIEFQKMEMQSQISKAKQNLNSTLGKQCSSKDRFSFSKHEAKEYRILSIATEVDQGDSLHKLLKSLLSCTEDVTPMVSELSTGGGDEDYQSNILDENDFIVHLKSLFLQLCWCSSFKETRSRYLINLIFSRCHELLTRFYKFLCKEALPEATNVKSKTITLGRLRDTRKSLESRDLLKHTKFYPAERGIAARQTFFAIAKILEVDASTGEIIIEAERFKTSRCSCIDRSEMDPSLMPTTPDNFTEKMEVDPSPNSGGNCSQKNFFIFDVVALAHDIVQEITIKSQSAEYEGVLSSILHLYSVLCSRDTNLIHEKQETLISNTIRKILFSLPSFTVIGDIVEFLSSSSQYSFSALLCCRSAAETFSENFKCFNFTRETCMLQVLCVYIEMMKKTPTFVYNYTSWVLSSVFDSHRVTWVSNKTDSKLCECLQLLEQITIKVILGCIEQYNDNTLPSSSKPLLKSSLSRVTSIFQLFRCKDVDFGLHIIPCRGEYKVMLRSLSEIMDDQRTKNFVTQEYYYVDDNRRYNLSAVQKNEVIKSFLKLYSYDYHL